MGAKLMSENTLSSQQEAFWRWLDQTIAKRGLSIAEVERRAIEAGVEVKPRVINNAYRKADKRITDTICITIADGLGIPRVEVFDRAGMLDKDQPLRPTEEQMLSEIYQAIKQDKQPRLQEERSEYRTKLDPAEQELLNSYREVADPGLQAAIRYILRFVADYRQGRIALGDKAGAIQEFLLRANEQELEALFSYLQDNYPHSAGTLGGEKHSN